jgi:hypothetical protein
LPPSYADVAIAQIAVRLDRIHALCDDTKKQERVGRCGT